MKKAIYIFCLALFSSCADLNPVEFDHYDARQVEGLWHRQLNEDWVCHFSDGLLTQSVFGLNAEIIQDKYAYRTNEDSVFMRDLTNGKMRIWTVYFEDENNFTATVVQPFGLVHKFTKFR